MTYFWKSFGDLARFCYEDMRFFKLLTILTGTEETKKYRSFPFKGNISGKSANAKTIECCEENQTEIYCENIVKLAKIDF